MTNEQFDMMMMLENLGLSEVKYRKSTEPGLIFIISGGMLIDSMMVIDIKENK